jgi:fatty-acyl-CoA synthase
MEVAGQYEALMETAGDEFDFPEFDEHTRATTFYTTGTTGDPKGVCYSHRQLVLHTLGVLSGLAISPEQGYFRRGDVYMPITPMFHVHAWGLPYVATLMGVKQVYPGRYAPRELLGLIEREKVTFSHCVPTILHMLLSDPLAKEIDLSKWRVVIGGSGLPRGLAEAAMALGIDVYGGYGLSETCPVVTLAQLGTEALAGSRERQLYYRCTAGRALPLVEIRVVDEHMNDVPRDGRATGEVVLRSPWLTHGYLKDAQSTAALWRGGYLHTGDIGSIDPEGYLKITDRIKDVIKSGGEWISSLALEDIVSRHPAVSEVAAIGVPDEMWGERPMLIVVPAEDAGEGVDEEAIRGYVAEFADAGEISKWAVPDRVVFVDAIAKTSVGKIDKKRLRQEALQR